MILKIFICLVLLSTSSFAKDLNFSFSEWNFATYNGAMATFDNGNVNVVNGGSDYWHIQLTRKNIELLNGKTYELRLFLQGVGVRRYVEIRIGRDGFPYDAFAEFGEVVATVNGRIITKSFTVHSGDAKDARLELNFGKYVGSVYFSDVSLKCLDCDTEQNTSASSSNAREDWNYAVVADTVDFRDNSMALGDLFASNLELGADSKIYGSMDVSGECFLRERAHIYGDLRYASPCVEQNNVFAKTKTASVISKPIAGISNITSGIVPVSVDSKESVTIPPGNYGIFYANTGAKVFFTSGTYTFQNFYTEPDVEFSFNLKSGPLSIGIQNDVRFGDRNHFSVTGGNPSEIAWNVAGLNVDLGTDGLYFGKIIAPDAFVRIPSRSHLVGSVFSCKFTLEPYSTISQEPLAKEISHSEEHFGPFFKPKIFRYVAQLPLSTSALEMFVYADGVQVKIDGSNSTTVKLPSANETVRISLIRNQIPGFPADAFFSKYEFNFTKNENYRIYWNPQTDCKLNCDGKTIAGAIGNFAEVRKIAQSSGREIHMVGGVWKALENFPDSVVPWPVGFELVGNTDGLENLTSENDLPLIHLENAAHVEIEGKSPRSLVGFRIKYGFNAGNGGAIYADNQKVRLKNMFISSSKSNHYGGAVFSRDTLNVENVRFENNVALDDGGAVFANGKTKMLNVLYLSNSSAKNGGAVELKNAETYMGNIIFYNNKAESSGGAIHNENSQINLWNATFFSNSAGKYGAIGGDADGVIGNSIFWKNTASECSSEECSPEVALGYRAMNSSFSALYEGFDCHIGDPKFADEMHPEGENMYMNYDAGINLAEDSPLLKAGVKSKDSPTYDLLAEERLTDSIALGVYAYSMPKNEMSFGVLNKEGKVVSVKPSIPLISAISGDYYREYLATSPYARVFKASVKKHKKSKKDKANVKLWVKNREGKIYKDIPPVEFEVYRNGEENGRHIFQTQTLNQGKPVFFSRRPQDAGNYKDGIVIYMKAVSDYFYYEAQ